MKKKSLIVSLIVSMSLLIVGCNNGKSTSVKNNSKDDNSISTYANNENNDSKDSITAYVGNNIFESSLDPIKGAMSYGYSFTNNALTRVNPNSEYEGDLAESWSISEDSLIYTFNLKKGIKFQDGSDFTAEDVVFTYETVKNNQADNESVDLTRLKSVEAVDDYTVKFTLSEPYSPFFDSIALLGIVPSDAYDSKVFDKSPIGTGPWKVIQYNTDQQIIVQAYEDYYEGTPEIKQVTFVKMDSKSAFSNAKSGQLDIVMVDPNYSKEIINGMHLENLETMDVRNISLPYLKEQTMTDKDGNEILVGNNVTSDIAVRKALSIGINREQIIENALNGVGKKATGFTTNLVWGNPLVYDDNQKDIDQLLQCIETFFIKVNLQYQIHICKNKPDLLQNIKKSDLLFLDMEINEENGIDIGLELQELKHDCRIIITTSYSKYAIDGYKIHADRYFIKPINQLEFNLEMEAIIKKYIKKEKGILDKKSQVLIKIQNLILIICLQDAK